MHAQIFILSSVLFICLYARGVNTFLQALHIHDAHMISLHNSFCKAQYSANAEGQVKDARNNVL